MKLLKAALNYGGIGILSLILGGFLAASNPQPASRNLQQSEVQGLETTNPTALPTSVPTMVSIFKTPVPTLVPPQPPVENTIPSGASAICQDGTYSFSQHRQGTCSHHGGVAKWL